MSGASTAASLNAQLAGMTAAANAAALNSSYGQANDALTRGYGRARTDLESYLPKSLAALGQGYDKARASIAANYAPGYDAIKSGIAGLDPYAASGRAANGMLDNALGLNGAGGNAAATGAFQASPGYQFQVDQATDAAARKAAALGIAGSGNTMSAITTLGSNLANQEYGSWLDRLTASKNTGLTAAQGQLSGDTSLASLGAQQGNATAALDAAQGTGEASLYDTMGSRLSGLGTGLGTGQAGIYTGLGNALVNNSNNALNATTSAFTSAGKAQDASQQAGLNNALQFGGLAIKGLSSLAGFL